MSAWFGSSRKKSPKSGLGSSGNVEQPSGTGTGTGSGSPRPDLKLQGGGQGLLNPLAWDNIPTKLKEQFPHWKEKNPLTSPAPTDSLTSSESPGALYKSGGIGRQQPPPQFTLPYVVMDTDTLNSIAIKFETTPADLARLNKKLVYNFTIFSGDVLFVPDHDELERARPTPATPSSSQPKSAPVSVSHTSSSSDRIGEDETMHSASVSDPTTVTEDNGVLCSEKGGTGRDKKGTAEGKVEFQVFSPSSSPPSLVDCARDFVEEVTDTHIMIVSKYISEDQGCIHGNLVFNQTVLMFSPFRDDPIVKDYGPAEFELVIPLQDITLAAVARSVLPPSRLFMLTLSKDTVEQRENMETSHESYVEVQQKDDGSREKGEREVDTVNKRNGLAEEDVEMVISRADTQQQIMEERGKRSPGSLETEEERQEVMEERDEKVVDGGHQGVEEEKVVGGGPQNEEEEKVADGEPQNEEEENVADRGPQNEEEENVADGGPQNEEEENVADGGPQNEEEENIADGGPQNEEEEKVADGGPQNEEEEKVADRGHLCEEHLFSSASESVVSEGLHLPSSHKISESSVDSLLSDHAYFMHVCVSSRSVASYTYIPINRAVGVDIPSNDPFLTKQSSVHQVKTAFCFAVAQKRIGDIVHFLYNHRPAEDMPLPPSLGLASSWHDDCYVIFSANEQKENEELTFSDDYFTGGHSGESWEVFSMQDVSRYRFRIEKMEVDHILPLPVLHADSNLMQEGHLRALTNHLPSEAIGHDWVLIYSTYVHGISLRTLYRNMADINTPVVLLVQDQFKKLFGAVVTCSVRLCEKFVGTGESFLFSFPSESEEGSSKGDIAVYQWSGENSYILKGSPEGLYFGCGDGHTGLWLDEHLRNGTSQACSTFNNLCLATHEEFECMGLEAWGFLYN